MITANRLEWRKSSFSGNGENCVEVAPSHGWRTSSFSGNGENCVQVTPSDNQIYMRHSKHPDAGTITFDLTAWHQFLTVARTGTPDGNGTVTVTPDGSDTIVHCRTTGTTIRYDDGEWTAFRAGADHGEFDFHPATASPQPGERRR
ncbi:DUF397 domain-containing protein [Nocardia sp. NPDC050193]